MNVYLLAKERSEERWIKQDLPTTRGLVICAECDLIVEVTHNLVKKFFFRCNSLWNMNSLLVLLFQRTKIYRYYDSLLYNCMYNFEATR